MVRFMFVCVVSMPVAAPSAADACDPKSDPAYENVNDSRAQNGEPLPTSVLTASDPETDPGDEVQTTVAFQRDTSVPMTPVTTPKRSRVMLA